jgi:hypothetical protein
MRVSASFSQIRDELHNTGSGFKQRTRFVVELAHRLLDKALAVPAPLLRTRDRRRAVTTQGRSHLDITAPPRALLVSIYRKRNAEEVEALLREDDLSWCDVRLWSLDEVPESLERWTVGSGPGTKFALLNALLEGCAADQYVIVADDDIVFKRGSLRDLVTLGARAEFGLFQATHARHSYWSYRITKRFRLAMARETAFVEIGPLFVIAPAWRSAFLPFPDDIGMGWGLELEWLKVHQQGCRFGVVDDVSLVHLGPLGETYDVTEEDERLEQREREIGVSLGEMQRNESIWYRWQSTPPWRKDGQLTP